MNLLLDTNVYIDFLGRRPPFFEPACKVVAAGFFGDAKLWLPAHSANDAFYVLSRYQKAETVQHAMLESFEVISPVAPSPEDILRTARLNWPDYEDCLVSLCADKARADYLITRDPRGFERATVPAFSPLEWLALMEREHGLTYDSASLA